MKILYLLSDLMIPCIIFFIVGTALAARKKVYEDFTSGAKEGLRTAAKILPTLIGLLTAVSMVRASGLLEVLCRLAGPAAQAVGISPELLPLALLRPVSGSGASAYTLYLFQQFGPDSETGKIASVLSASTDTTFYAIAVYFGACGVKKLSYTVPAALLGDAAALVFSVLTVKLFG